MRGDSMSVGHKEHLSTKENVQEISLGGMSELDDSGFLGNEELAVGS